MSESNGHDSRGYFTKGNKLGRGNPVAKRSHELRKVLLDTTSAADVERVGRKLYEMALDGDVQAAQVWLSYIVGKPTQAVQVSGPDGKALGVQVIVAAVLKALGPYPEARLAVAGKLAAIEDARDVPNEGAGD